MASFGVARETEAASLRKLSPACAGGEETTIADRPNLALAHGMVSGMEGVSALAGRGGEEVGGVMPERHSQNASVAIGEMAILRQSVSGMGLAAGRRLLA